MQVCGDAADTLEITAIYKSIISSIFFFLRLLAVAWLRYIVTMGLGTWSATVDMWPRPTGRGWMLDAGPHSAHPTAVAQSHESHISRRDKTWGSLIKRGMAAPTNRPAAAW